MRRFGRKLEVEALRGELPLSAFFFDCLLRDGEPLVDRGARERHDAARRAARALRHAVARHRELDEAERVLLDDALAHGHEG